MIAFMCTASQGWLNDINDAKSQAKEKQKPILLYISGSDWCVPCMKQSKAVYETDKFKEYAEKNLVLLKADFPRKKKNELPAEQVKKNEAIAAQYDPEGHFPVTLLLDADGKVLKKWEGYAFTDTDAFVKEISACGK